MKRRGYYTSKDGFSRTEYKYVRRCIIDQTKEVKFLAHIPQLKKSKYFDLIRDAALQVDKWLIVASKSPVNILIPKP